MIYIRCFESLLKWGEQSVEMYPILSIGWMPTSKVCHWLNRRKIGLVKDVLPNHYPSKRDGAKLEIR